MEASKLLFQEETYRIIGAAMKVYNELGPGFVEAVYHEALEIEFSTQDIPFRSKEGLRIYYLGKPLRRRYEPDLKCFDSIIVELKAEKTLTPIDDAQLLHYLKATHLRVGILLNFGSSPKLQWRRLIL